MSDPDNEDAPAAPRKRTRKPVAAHKRAPSPQPLFLDSDEGEVAEELARHSVTPKEEDDDTLTLQSSAGTKAPPPRKVVRKKAVIVVDNDSDDDGVTFKGFRGKKRATRH